MKKYILAFMLIASAATYGQTSYKLGLVAPLPIDLQTNCTPEIRSVMVEMATKLGKKIDFTLVSGYLSFNYPNGLNGKFKNIPLMPGLRYNTSKLYFGANIGPSFWSESIQDQNILWSPYVGMNTGKISLDFRYFNWRQISNSANALGIVVSYNL